MRKTIYLFLMIFLTAPLALMAQKNDADFCLPFDFDIFLSGNFAELRSNHFHSGLDFKTLGVTGKPIKCVADGYILRASVQPGGYGQALYVVHDNGYMTVYGHLHRFPEAVADKVRDAQYEKESFSVVVDFDSLDLRVKKGELLAYAGNSGYSFGPHLHFEIRNIAGNELYDPLPFYADKIKDKRPPVAKKVAIYPYPGAGVVDSSASSRTYDIKNNILPDTIEAWGTVGFGIKALDYMDGTNNKYGVYQMQLFVDEELYFSSKAEHFSFEENRLINSWTDYSRYVKDGEWFQRMYIHENNPLRMLNANHNRGWLDVKEERLYKVECRLTDYHGNCSNYVFNVLGKPQEIPDVTGGFKLSWMLDNKVEYGDMYLLIPDGQLFCDAVLDVAATAGEYGFSDRYSFGDEILPFRKGATLSIKVDPGYVDTAKLYIKRITDKGGHSEGGTYKQGRITAEVGSLGCFEVAADTVAPSITPVKEKMWMRNGKVVFGVKEKETSVSSFRGTLNGKYILFSYSSKNGRIELDLKKENVRRGKHLLRLEVTDACGNTAVYEKNIDYR